MPVFRALGALVASAVALGALAFSSAASSQETVYAWGWNGPPAPPAPAEREQLGNRSQTGQVVGLTDGARSVAAGRTFSVALMSDGTVRTWGWNRFSQLGNGKGGTAGGEWASKTPVVVCVTTIQPSPGTPRVCDQKLENVRSISAGAFHALALVDPDGDQKGTVWGWGHNSCNQLGAVLPTAANPAFAVPGLPTNIVAISAGKGHNLALDAEGQLWAWGDNFSGQLGNGVDPQRAGSSPRGFLFVTTDQCYPDEDPTLTEVQRDKNYPSIEVGLPQAVPTPVLLPDKVMLPQPGASGTFSAGSDHSLAITRDGRVWSWGNNCAGQLGISDPASPLAPHRGIPLPVGGLPGGEVVAVAGGGRHIVSGGHSLALTKDGRVLAWGEAAVLGGSKTPDEITPASQESPCASDPQLPATISAQPSPVVVEGITDATSIEAGSRHSVAITAPDPGVGKLQAWGSNSLNETSIPAGALGGSFSLVSATDHNLALAGLGPPRPAYEFIPAVPSPDTSAVEDLIDDAPDPNDVIDEVPDVEDPDDPPDPDEVQDSVDEQMDEAAEEIPDQPEVGTVQPGGGLFVTGHAADIAVVVPNNGPLCPEQGCPGAKNFIRRAIAYATGGKASPRLLYVLGNPTDYIGANNTAADGMERAGFMRCSGSPSPSPWGCFEIAFKKSAYPPAAEVGPSLDLQSVQFGDYDAVVVGSQQRLFNMDVLEARSEQLRRYVNEGGGLVALPTTLSYHQCDADGLFPTSPEHRRAESRACANRTPGHPDKYTERNRYLPFISERHFGPPGYQGEGDPDVPDWNCSASSTPATASNNCPTPPAFTVTPEGVALGIAPSDVNSGMGGNTWYPCSLDEVFTRYHDGRIVTHATRKPIPPSEVCGKVTSVQVREGQAGQTDAVFTVTLDRSDLVRSSPVVVQYRTLDGTGRGGTGCGGAGRLDGPDYVRTSGDLTFSPQDVPSKTVRVPVCGDTAAESDETFLLELTGSERFRVTGTGTILNDDAPPGSGPDAIAPPGTPAVGGSVQGGPAQPPAQVALPAAAAASSPAAAFAPAISPIPVVVQTNPSYAQAQAQAQVTAQSPAHSAATSLSQAGAPQTAPMLDRQRQRQVERALADPGAYPAELLASSHDADPTRTVAVVLGATLLSLGMIAFRRRAGVFPDEERQLLRPGDAHDGHVLIIRRLRAQR